MLTRWTLTLAPDRPVEGRWEWAYPLYADLLDQLPRELGTALHDGGVTPVSQYLDCRGETPVWRVSLLGRESERALGPWLDRAEDFSLRRDGVSLRVICRQMERVEDAETLLAMGAAHPAIHKLRFLTPTVFKSQGEYVKLPTPRLILQSLIKKWNGSIPECPIEDEGEGLEALAAGLRVRDFNLRSAPYPMKNQLLPGFVGELDLENHLEGFHRQLAAALLLFADYAGVGAKTTLGMGGVAHEKGG